jgi:2'-5' RNA ligase/GNAT superfamily N-acetyltransferase
VATRRRLGVALVLDPPVSDAIDGLRRAVGDPSLNRIPPHVTLVPPVNVRADQLSAALARVRAAAASQPGPLHCTLGPPATFLPDNPVLYLEVGGDLERLRTLRDAVFVTPLSRPLSWPWVPHVTLADSADEDRIRAAVAALDRFAVVAAIDRLVLLEETSGRVWVPLADAALGPEVVVGRGGLSLNVTRGRMLDPEGWQMIDEAGARPADLSEEAACQPGRDFFPIVLTVRREGQVVGVAFAWRADDGGHAAVIVAPAARRQGIGSTALAHLESAVVSAGWAGPVLHAHGPAGFYRARSAYSKATEA